MIWLSERRLDLALRRRRPEAADASPRAPDGDPDLAVGQVRVLPFWMCPGAPRSMVHAAILAAGRHDSWRVAMFSNYRTPGSRRELRTSLYPDDLAAAPALRVLELWNSFWLPGDVMRRTWHFTDLPLRDVRAAVKVLRLGGPAAEDPDQPLAKRLGPPDRDLGLGVLAWRDYVNEESCIRRGLLQVAQGLVAVNPVPRWTCIVQHEVAGDLVDALNAASGPAVWTTPLAPEDFCRAVSQPSGRSQLRFSPEWTRALKRARLRVSRPAGPFALTWRWRDAAPAGAFEWVQDAPLRDPASGEARQFGPLKLDRPPPATALAFDERAGLLARGVLDCKGMVLAALDSVDRASLGRVQVVACGIQGIC